MTDRHRRSHLRSRSSRCHFSIQDPRIGCSDLGADCVRRPAVSTPRTACDCSASKSIRNAGPDVAVPIFFARRVCHAEHAKSRRGDASQFHLGTLRWRCHRGCSRATPQAQAPASPWSAARRNHLLLRRVRAPRRPFTLPAHPLGCVSRELR